MDFSHSQEDASKTSRKRTPEENGSLEVVPSKPIYYTPPTRPQNWSLPESIIYYMAMNPKSPKLYQKLIRTCKYFFYKNPVIVCSCLEFSARTNVSQIEIVANEKTKLFDLNNISQFFWITGVVTVNSYETVGKENVMSSLIPHIYRCEVTSLFLSYQHISWNQYLFLAANVEFVIFEKCMVKNECGSIVPVEKLLEVAVYVTEFYGYLHENHQSVSSKTVQNLLQIPHFATLKDFRLIDIPDSFDIDTFFAYIKKNNYTDFFLRFTQFISDAYKNRLESIVDEIIDAESDDYTVCIVFDGQDLEKRKKLNSLYNYSRRSVFDY